MAAPLGNRFWELRSSHGRDKLFATPELMWEAACEYFAWVEDNPFLAEDFISSGPHAGGIVVLNKKRPFTLHSLCIYLDCNTQYFKIFKAQLPKDEKGFNTIITRIEETIYAQKFEGAASGFFNANIIARDLGLADKSDVTNNTYTVEVKEE